MLIGIDIGTHSARAAALDQQGRPFLIGGNDQALMPAVVRYTMHGPEVGDYPARYLVSNWENTVRGCTRLLARYGDLPPRVVTDSPFPIMNRDGQVRLNLLYAEAAPEEVYALLVAALCERAEHSCGELVDEVVLTVPAGADDRFRVLVRQAAESLGLRVRRLLNQPTAALLALRSLRPDQAGSATLWNSGARIAVVDVGGGTTEVSIARIDGSAVHIVASEADGFLGGHDLARRVAEGLDGRLRSQAGRSLLAAEGSRVQALGLLHAAEEALESLALAPQVPIAIDHGAGFGHDLYLALRREQAEDWLAPELERIGAVCRRALGSAQVQESDLAAVVLVGGAHSFPGVRRAVSGAFGRLPGDLLVREPLALAAYGAALAATLPATSIWDVTPYPLGINCNYRLPGGSWEERFSPIVPANAPIPTPGIGQSGAHTESYSTMHPGQTSVHLDVLQYRGPKQLAPDSAERVFPPECETLGSWDFSGLHPRRGGHSQFTVTFAVDADGILHLLAEETGTGHRLTGQVARSI